jgi:hypothetical protein
LNLIEQPQSKTKNACKSFSSRCVWLTKIMNAAVQDLLLH